MAFNSLPSEIPRTMQAQFLDGYNQPYTFRETPVPRPDGPFDLLLKVDAASYCHTDHVLGSGHMAPNPSTFPHIGSHEFAGTVVALPSEPASNAPSYKIGDRVGVPGRSYRPCGACFECEAEPSEENPHADLKGYSVYCSNSENLGISTAGGFREYAVVDARQVGLLPDGLEAVDAAPLMCAGLTIFGALKRCKLKAGQRVGIIGCGGGLGHYGLQFARAMGLRVLGVEAADKPLELARSLQLDVQLVDARNEDASAVVEQLGKEDGKTDRKDMGLDAVIILPESSKSFEYGMSLLRNHSKLVLVSFPKDGFHLNPADVVFRDITIMGSLVGSNTLLVEMLEFAAENSIKTVKKTYPLAKLNELVEEYLKAEGGKLVVDMSLTS